MTAQSKSRTISLRETIGGHYDDVMAWKGRYIAIIGSRASKKSYTIAYKLVLGMMAMPYANTLVVRKTSNSNKQSTYAQIVKCIYLLGLERYWEFSKSTLDITYKPTGQVIVFRGLDDPYKLSSIQVVHGVLCWCWFEEAYQIPNEAMFENAIILPDFGQRLSIKSGDWLFIRSFSPLRISGFRIPRLPPRHLHPSTSISPS